MEDRYVNDVEAAKILSVSPQSMRNWRCMRRGPAYSKRGRLVRYSFNELMRYMKEGNINPGGGNGD
jgi:hypothetical protein